MNNELKSRFENLSCRKINELKRRLLRDFVVVGQSAVKTSINTSGVIKLKYMALHVIHITGNNVRSI